MPGWSRNYANQQKISGHNQTYNMSMPNNNRLNNPLSVGLLLCDDVDQSAQAQYGNYAQMFQNGVDPSKKSISLTPIRCFEGEALPQPTEYDGYIITGSRCGAYEDLPWIGVLQAFIQESWEQKTKVVGICFGHQLIAHSLGGKTEKAAAGWGFGIHSAKIIDRKPWMTDTDNLNRDRYNLIVIHQDQVVNVPPQFKTIAENDFCPNSMIVADNKMLGIQGHPEFNKAFCRERAEFRKELLGPEVYQATLNSLAKNETHSKTVFNWVNNFLHL
ncbi:homoserine O-acetyltransferase/O-succinyltransferase family protein [Candidatus Spongiihabitans sp.]|uniref:homoserine O-acetyltransferase/O-succinyltransferase family protein n=1 Tax=Candidatus Spongiihabitans sp. TaxID=3101308 RepID=UPI003C6F3D5E